MTADNFTPYSPQQYLYFTTLLFISILSKKIGPAKLVFAHAISNTQIADNSNSHFNQKNFKVIFLNTRSPQLKIVFQSFENNYMALRHNTAI